jgi:hypothetical protein
VALPTLWQVSAKPERPISTLHSTPEERAQACSAAHAKRCRCMLPGHFATKAAIWCCRGGLQESRTREIGCHWQKACVCSRWRAWESAAKFRPTVKQPARFFSVPHPPCLHSNRLQCVTSAPLAVNIQQTRTMAASLLCQQQLALLHQPRRCLLRPPTMRPSLPRPHAWSSGAWKRMLQCQSKVSSWAGSAGAGVFKSGDRQRATPPSEPRTC